MAALSAEKLGEALKLARALEAKLSGGVLGSEVASEAGALARELVATLAGS
eukprot:COSAG02_NODE_38859_length_424_cov_0.612308_1_plen_50_part_01